MKPGGFIGGDDFAPSVWGHSDRYEPTLVFPLAVYFAEAVGAPICALPFDQFLIQRPNTNGLAHGFVFIDPEGRYGDTSIGGQLRR